LAFHVIAGRAGDALVVLAMCGRPAEAENKHPF